MLLKINDISFPAYKLRVYEKLEERFGIKYITTIWDRYLLDDLNIESDDLITRRLKTVEPDKLYPLRDTIESIHDIVKYPGGSEFIDNKGNIFKYSKSNKYETVRCHKVIGILRKQGKTLISVKDINCVFIRNRGVYYTNNLYAHIVHTSKGYILYDINEDFKSPYKRKI